MMYYQHRHGEEKRDEKDGEEPGRQTGTSHQASMRERRGGGGSERGQALGKGMDGGGGDRRADGSIRTPPSTKERVPDFSTIVNEGMWGKRGS